MMNEKKCQQQGGDVKDFFHEHNIKRVVEMINANKLFSYELKTQIKKKNCTHKKAPGFSGAFLCANNYSLIIYFCGVAGRAGRS
jgi:hypothetical protein